MQADFPKCLAFLLAHEGGFSNNPTDPGGITNLGVTKRQWEAYVGHSVIEQDIRNLTPVRVESFYKTRYWDAVKGDDLPAGLDHCLFDTCVNSGPGRAIVILQKILGVVTDAAMGPHTLDAAYKQATARLVDLYCRARMDFLKTLPTWSTFGKGWEARVTQVEAEADSLASQPEY